MYDIAKTAPVLEKIKDELKSDLTEGRQGIDEILSHVESALAKGVDYKIISYAEFKEAKKLIEKWAKGLRP